MNNHPILKAIKAELLKFSDSTIEIFYSFLCKNTQKHTDIQQIIKYKYYINHLCLDDNRFRKNFAHTSTWAVYEYFAKNIIVLIKKNACFLL